MVDSLNELKYFTKTEDYKNYKKKNQRTIYIKYNVKLF